MQYNYHTTTNNNYNKKSYYNKNACNKNNNENKNNNGNNNLLLSLKDYMFTTENLMRFTKHMIQHDMRPKSITKILFDSHVNTKEEIVVDEPKDVPIKRHKQLDTTYKPKQKDSLFWCFYILKNGYFNYEMEIRNQYFVVEKTEKFKYIEMIRKHKDLIKLHKIKPFTELEDDLANKPKISIKTFFALCILENINVLLVDKRKIYEITCVDIDDTHPVNVIHRNSLTCEHHIELNVSNDNLKKYRDTYYKMDNFDATIKGIGSYKLDELIDLCKKLDINIENNTTKKQTKKDIYELLVLNY